MEHNFFKYGNALDTLLSTLLMTVIISLFLSQIQNPIYKAKFANSYSPLTTLRYLQHEHFALHGENQTILDRQIENNSFVEKFSFEDNKVTITANTVVKKEHPNEASFAYAFINNYNVSHTLECNFSETFFPAKKPTICQEKNTNEKPE